MWRNIIAWIYYYWLLTSTCSQAAAIREVCGSIEINDPNNLILLRNCNVIYGHVRIALFTDTIDNVADLATNVEVITGYLLVYRANGIESLQAIFPKLMLIRGEELYHGKYALVVFENRHLKDLGLISLLRVQKGNIRIQSNPQLCFVETINWVYLLENAKEQHFSIKNNKHPNFCPVCIQNSEMNRTPDAGKTDMLYFQQYCWNLKFYQLNSATKHTINCSPHCHPSFGCKAVNRTCCDRNCITECRTDKCDFCASLRSNGRCVKVCTPPNNYMYAQTDCVTAATCRSYNLIPHNNACKSQCPKHHKLVTDTNGYKLCEKICTGNFVIQKIEDMAALEKCPIIEGSVTMELMNIKTEIDHLENLLGDVKEITGYLRIIRSPQIFSLNFFKSLDTIRGNELFEQKYALVVVNNANMEHLWDDNQNVAILNGAVYFHLNPRLCPEKIFELKPMLKNSDITYADVSMNSNGERVVCGSYLITLNATVEDKNATAARIKVMPFSSEDLYALKGYVHYYRESNNQNLSMFDGRQGCGHDDWYMDVSPNRNIRHVLNNLKPFTQYAVFVKTITMIDHHLQKEGYSPIIYFQTLPSKPGPVQKIYYHAPSENEIVVHWWPPLNANGVIDRYLITMEEFIVRTDDITVNVGKENSFERKACECNLTDPYESGPQPFEENYFIREQITYEEILPNIIYTRAIPPNLNITYASEEERKKAEEAEKRENQDRSQKFVDFIKNLETRALNEQDTGIKDFLIVHPFDVCGNETSTTHEEHQTCTQPEIYEYGVEVPAIIHTYKFQTIKPELTYKISIRACVKDLINPCGPLKSLMAKTARKTIHEYMREFEDNL